MGPADELEGAGANIRLPLSRGFHAVKGQKKGQTVFRAKAKLPGSIPGANTVNLSDKRRSA